MTDIEMDLLLAKAEISNLKKTIETLTGTKCNFGAGIVVKPDGKNELDPCIYEDVEVHTNVTVVVKRCTKCGHTEIVWHRQDDTEDFVDGDLGG